MIIEDKRTAKLEVEIGGRYIEVKQHDDIVVIGRQQATQLIAVLQKWVDGGEVE